MKVLVVTNMYPTPERPYLGIFVQEQVESLRAIGCEVDVEACVAGPGAWRVGVYGRGLWRLWRRLRRGDFDVIHSHHSYSTVMAWAARRLAGSRASIVMTFHEGEALRRNVGGGDGAGYAGQGAATRMKYSPTIKAFALRRADWIIPVQRAMTAAVLGEAEAAKLRQEVIPAGIDLERFSPGPRAEARERLGWPVEGTCVLFPGSPAHPEKRADRARAGFELWRARSDEGRRDQARLVVGGAIPYAQMPDAMRAADAVLLTSDYEASPTAVKEALACARPVVATDVGDVRERFGDLACVTLCDGGPTSVADAIDRALAWAGSPDADPQAGRRRLVEQGLGLAQVAERVLAAYREALQIRARND
jgi:glycosyltransferase involved in cell wall biosynthesis